MPSSTCKVCITAAAAAQAVAAQQLGSQGDEAADEAGVDEDTAEGADNDEVAIEDAEDEGDDEEEEEQPKRKRRRRRRKRVVVPVNLAEYMILPIARMVRHALLVEAE